MIDVQAKISCFTEIKPIVENFRWLFTWKKLLFPLSKPFWTNINKEKEDLTRKRNFSSIQRFLVSSVLWECYLSPRSSLFVKNLPDDLFWCWHCFLNVQVWRGIISTLTPQCSVTLTPCSTPPKTLDSVCSTWKSHSSPGRNQTEEEREVWSITNDQTWDQREGFKNTFLEAFYTALQYRRSWLTSLNDGINDSQRAR